MFGKKNKKKGELPEKGKKKNPVKRSKKAVDPELEPTTKRLKLIGSRYMGDGLDLKKNEVVELSIKKANQLLSDFPDLWIETEEEVTTYESEINSHGKMQINVKALR